MRFLNPKVLARRFGRQYVLEWLLFIVFLFFFYLPLFNNFLLAFNNTYNFSSVLPLDFGLNSWRQVFQQQDLVTAMVNSFLIATLATILSIVICIPAAYALGRFQFKGKNFFLFSFLLSNAFPKIGLYTALGVLFYRYHLIGTLPGVLIVHILNTMIFMIWIPSNSFLQLQAQQEEAARDIGANSFQIFLKVALPAAIPGIAVAAIYTFLGSLEEAQGTLLVGLPQIKTMATAMYGLILDGPPMVGAVFSILLIVPTIFILWICRKIFGKEIFSGGMKF